jgi:hypothetical protein
MTRSRVGVLAIVVLLLLGTTPAAGSGAEPPSSASGQPTTTTEAAPSAPEPAESPTSEPPTTEATEPPGPPTTEPPTTQPPTTQPPTTQPPTTQPPTTQPLPAPAESDVLAADPAELLALAPIPAVGSANARFVRLAYRELLGRDADAGGLDWFLSFLASGGPRTREAVGRQLLFSREGAGNEVARAYAELLGRTPEPAGRAYWTEILQSRPVAELRVLIIASDEFYLRAGGTPERWMDAVYRSVLGRAPDPGGAAYWLGLVQRGLSRPAVVTLISESPEQRLRRVIAIHGELLGRAPTATELTAGLALLASREERDLRARVLASDELYHRIYDAVFGA